MGVSKLNSKLNYDTLKELSTAFNRSRGVIADSATVKKEPAKKERKNSPEDVYLDKCSRGDINSFNSLDFTYYFRDSALRNEVRYVITNVQKDRHTFKLLLERGFTKEEIVGMIEFVFDSPQNYLDKQLLHPGILLTKWSSSIVQDSKLWLSDEYVPTKTQKSGTVSDFTKNKKKSNEASIGEWD